ETALTVFKRAPAQPAAQAGGRDRGTKDCADTGTLNGMQNLYRFRLLFRALPPRMLCAVCRALADGISGIVSGISINTPAFDVGHIWTAGVIVKIFHGILLCIEYY